MGVPLLTSLTFSAWYSVRTIRCTQVPNYVLSPDEHSASVQVVAPSVRPTAGPHPRAFASGSDAVAAASAASAAAPPDAAFTAGLGPGNKLCPAASGAACGLSDEASAATLGCLRAASPFRSPPDTMLTREGGEGGGTARFSLALPRNPPFTLYQVPSLRRPALLRRSRLRLSGPQLSRSLRILAFYRATSFVHALYASRVVCALLKRLSRHALK